MKMQAIGRIDLMDYKTSINTKFSKISSFLLSINSRNARPQDAYIRSDFENLSDQNCAKVNFHDVVKDYWQNTKI